jgi:hypothetical protein
MVLARPSAAFAIVLFQFGIFAMPMRAARAEEEEKSRIAVTFSGGYDTVGIDKGRPVKLIAAALGVPDEVFRDAFSRVRPASGGREPEPGRARENKAVLMKALGPYGITNNRLDEVSDYYRYRPGKGKLWRHEPASAIAIVKNGVITGFEVTRPGAGYTTPPRASVPGFPQARIEVQLGFDQDFSRNGRITTMTLQNAN